MRMSLMLAAFVAAFLALPVQAQTLQLLCTWPANPCCDTVFNIDLSSGRVSWYSTSAPSSVYGPAKAQITEFRISWSWRFPNNRWGPTNFVIDRIRGQNSTCGPDFFDGKYECDDIPKECKPLSTAKPVF